MNTSGSSQWITCPMVRNTFGDIESAAIEFSGAVSNPRLEMRNVWGGSLVGWSFDNESTGPGAFKIYTWFDSGTGNADAFNSFAFEANMPNNIFVYDYTLNENTAANEDD